MAVAVEVPVRVWLSAYGFPAVAVPECVTDRLRLLTEFRQGRDDAAVLFKFWPVTDFERLQACTRNVYVSIVEGSLRLRARPPRWQLLSVKQVLISGCSDAGWSAVAVELFTCWVANFYAPTNDWVLSELGNDPGRLEAVKRWPAAVACATAWPDSPLQDCVDAAGVDEWLLSVLRLVAS